MLPVATVFKFVFRRFKTHVGKMEREMKVKLSEMSAAELREEVIKLQKRNRDLVNLIKKKDESDDKKNHRSFEFKDTRKRHVLLWISYLGWSFDGFVSQTHTNYTVEDIVWEALYKTRLVEDIKKANYSRCGRTDKGVSAFSQVIGVDVRSIQPYDHSPLVTPELPYCSMLNKALPKDIRVIAWRPAAENLNARFDCIRRTYKYFFPKGNLNIEAMSEACTFIEGTHDFRNLCKMDVQNGVTKFVRTIDSAKISHLEIQRDLIDPEFDMFVLTVESSGFLYHQIRCMMHILFLVGQGFEKTEIVKDLLDVEKNPQKPQYNPAHELPLNLFQVEYPSDGFQWVFEEKATNNLLNGFLEDWCIHACKTAMVRSIVKEMSGLSPAPLNFNAKFMANAKGTHRPLMSRQKCESVETMVKRYTCKRKLTVVEDENGIRKIVKAPKIRIDISEADEETPDESENGEGQKMKLALKELCITLEGVDESKRTAAENVCNTDEKSETISN